jgi:uncharacterized protein YkwD
MRARATPLALALAALPHSAWAYGEADAQGRPSAAERRLHLLTNQVRAEPHAFPGWPTTAADPEPRPPLALHPGLSAAARFHAEDMAQAGCFQHSSCDGTPTADRIARFFTGPAGENIAKGQRSPAAVMVAWMNSDGHRANILRPQWNALGAGVAPGDHWVQNFGAARGLEAPPIVAGAAFSEAGGVRLAAHAFDPAGRPPARFEARLDGAAVPLTPAFGRPGHRTWEARAPAPTACADLAFFLEDAAGAVHRFPTTGVLLVGAGCSASFRAGPATEDPRRPVIDADPAADLGGCRCAEPGTRGGRAAPGAAALGLLGLAAVRRRRARAPA